MVFLMLGTQKQNFDRLLNIVENSKALKDEKIIAQIGHTKYSGKRIETFDFLESSKLQEIIKESDYIITQGGVGSIFAGILNNKKVLAIPRLKKYNEHVDDHQIEICKKLSSLGYITFLDELDDFDSKIKFLKESEFETYIEDKKYISKLKKTIDELID